MLESLVCALTGTVGELVVAVVVDETWSLKAPPGTEKEEVVVVRLPVELWVNVLVVVELLEEVTNWPPGGPEEVVGSQSSPSSVVLGVLELDVRGSDVVEAVFDDGPVGKDVVEDAPVVEEESLAVVDEESPEEVLDWKGRVELDVSVVDEVLAVDDAVDLVNWVTDEEVVEETPSVEVELTGSLVVGSQSSVSGGAVVEETPMEVEDVKNCPPGGPEEVVDAVPEVLPLVDWVDTLPVVDEVLLTLLEVRNWPPGGPEEVVEAVDEMPSVEVELVEPLLVESQSSGSGGAVVEETLVEVEDVKN